MSGTAALQPTYYGHVASTQDALLLFEACLTGQLSHVPRRPHDRERNHLIRSGSVFIYEENASGIKRWTDGVTWSPSRILGNFLVYRELDKPFPPGEKKRAMKKNKRIPRPGEPYPRQEDGQYSPVMTSPGFNEGRQPSDVERALIGSLIDSYGFKDNGLVKKTMSVTVQGVTHHLVSYYNVNEVVSGNLTQPTQDDKLKYLRPRPELTQKQSFRSPLEEAEDNFDGSRDGQQAYTYRGGMLGPPGYSMPAPGGFYPSQGAQYPPNNYYPPSTAAGYGVGIPAHGYLAQPVSNPPFKTEHDSYANPPHYSRGYESIPSGSPTSSLPPSMSSIAATTQSPHQSVYAQTSLPARQPTGLDTRNGQPYSRPSYGNGQTQPPDVRRQMQPSPSHGGDRREGPPVQQSVYPGTSDRQSYYGMNGSATSLGHSHYPSNSGLPSWSGGPPGTQQI